MYAFQFDTDQVERLQDTSLSVFVSPFKASEAESKAADNKSADNKLVDNTPVDNQSSDNKSADPQNEGQSPVNDTEKQRPTRLSNKDPIVPFARSTRQGQQY